MKALRAAGLVLMAAVAAQAAPPPRVLIFSGQNNHDWKTTTPALVKILGAAGIAAEVTERPDQCTDASLAKFDAILSNWNSFGKPDSATHWPAETRDAFLKFAREGKGVVAVHAGSSSFYDWPEYQQLGMAFWKSGQTSHGPMHTFTVTASGEHPVTRGLQPFTTKDELWIKPGVHPGATVLAVADGQPVAFATSFGKGRGFTLLLGHNAESMNNPGFQTLLLRGVEWAASGAVTGSHTNRVPAAVAK
ncbi:MAG: ThuA domain-containing protein [Lentisphaerae bacterium]|nr:ThuA domain-containing protein [Lentisphaerota bacterium]